MLGKKIREVTTPHNSKKRRLSYSSLIFMITKERLKREQNGISWGWSWPWNLRKRGS